ncbi:hypothetical protein B4168_1900 [Anoxybacillus flavithermus]|nr:hypothetical protein B4168_1900 [Anoxybacillus flavithermus]OAO85555.1 hypothetical protein GT23_2458 [Parageobacillus thermoglucosidasius]
MLINRAAESFGKIGFMVGVFVVKAVQQIGYFKVMLHV